MMTISQLSADLEKILSDFSSEIRSNYPEDSSKHVTEQDINELARQTFYAMDEFRKKIVMYLSEN